MLAVQPIDMRSNIRIAGGLVTANRVLDLGGGIVEGELLDKSPSGLDATLLTARAVSFDGVGDYGTVPTNAAFNIAGTTKTISIWFYVSAYPGSGGRWAFAKGEAGVGGFGMYVDAATTSIGFVTFRTDAGSNYSYVRCARPAIGVWHLLSFTATNAVCTGISINGVAQSLTVVTAATGTYGDSTLAFLVGCGYGSGVPASFMPCQLADVQISGGPRYRLNSHPDVSAAGLNGLPMIDSSGLGLHGTFVGCDGLRNLGIPVDLRGLGAYEDYMWFDGVDDAVTNVPCVVGGGTTRKIEIAITKPTSTTLQFAYYSNNADYLQQNAGGATWYIRAARATTASIWEFNSAVLSSGLNTLVFQIDTATGTGCTLSVNGGSPVSLTVIGAAGSGNLLATSSLSWVGRGNTGDYFSGLINGVKFNDVLIAEGNGITSAAWGGGTVSGSPNTIGELRRFPPQVAALDCNRRMWFDGVNDLVTYADSDDFEINTGSGDQPFEVSCDYFAPSSTFAAVVPLVCKDTSSTAFDWMFYFNTTILRALIGTQTGVYLQVFSDCGISGLHNYKFTYNGDGTLSGLKLFRDGVEQVVSTASVGVYSYTGSTATVKVGQRLAFSTQRLVGMVQNIIIKKNGVTVLSAVGSGNTSAAWSGGTVTGSPENILLPATDINPALDAYGNAIANPRPTANTINLPGDGASFSVADNAALGAVKTVCGWVYHSGANATLLDCGTPTLTVASNVLGSSGWTSPTLYVNGVAGTALAVGWNHVALTTATATDCGPIDGTVTCDRWLFYSEALSAAQILKNYNATKRSFT